MSDPNTRAQAEALLAAIRGDVQRMINTALRRPTGIVAGVYENSTVTFDQYGRALYAADGSPGGGGGLTRDGFVIGRDSTSQTITSGSWQAISWDYKEYDDGYIFGGTPFTQLEMTSSQQWLTTIDVRWDSQFSGNVGAALTTTGGGLYIADARPAISSGSLENWHTFTFISYWHGSAQNARVYQDSGSSKTLIAYMYAQAIYSKT
jgi:hypothetical protein